MSDSEKIRVSWERERRVLRLTLAAGKGNILSAAVDDALAEVLEALDPTDDYALSVVVLDADGPDFSYGASIQEHRKAEVAGLFASFHGLLRTLSELDVPTAALVKGRCLGGGLELAAFCDFLFVEEGATLGLPEIRLGVFPPVGSALLPHRIGSAAATAMVLSGEEITGKDAHRLGLAYRCAPEGFVAETFDSWVGDTLLPLSASSLRHATRAARRPWLTRFWEDLAAAERTYLEELVETHDANEGLNAFLEKRAPHWQHGRIR